jgi:hypothetical protein
LARDALAPPDATSLERAFELIRQRELGPWVPDCPALHAAAERIADLAKSELVVADGAREEQIHAIVGEAIGGIFDAAAAARCADQFDEMAYVEWKRDREDEARACLAAADVFRGDSDRQHALARAMLQAILEPVITALKSGKTKPASASE